jgi:hypothetical protein
VARFPSALEEEQAEQFIRHLGLLLAHLRDEAPPGQPRCRAGPGLAPARRLARGDQKMTGHQGAGSQDIAVDSTATAPGVCSVTSPARASVPSWVPPR